MRVRHILSFVALGFAVPAAGQTASSVYVKNRASVYLVENRDGGKTGSAVVVLAPAVGAQPGQSMLATNCHVVSDARSVVVRNGATGYTAEISHCDKARDIALLSVQARLPAVRTRSASTLVVGESVYSIGAPKGMELTIGNGVVSQIRSSSGGAAGLVQTTAPISPGSSGGGLFDAKGNLVALTTLLIRDAQAINFAVPIDWVLEVISGKRLSPKSAGQVGTSGEHQTEGLSSTNLGAFELKGIKLGQHCRDQTLAVDRLVAEGYVAQDATQESDGIKRLPTYCSPDNIAEFDSVKYWSRFQSTGSTFFNKGVVRIDSSFGRTTEVGYEDLWISNEGTTIPTVDHMQVELRRRFGDPAVAIAGTSLDERRTRSTAKKEPVEVGTLIWLYSSEPIAAAEAEEMNRQASHSRLTELLKKRKGEHLLVLMEEVRSRASGLVLSTSLKINLSRQAVAPAAPALPQISL